MGNSFSTNVFFTSKHLKIATVLALSSILLTSFAKKVHDIYVDEENDGTEEIDNDNEEINLDDAATNLMAVQNGDASIPATECCDQEYYNWTPNPANSSVSSVPDYDLAQAMIAEGHLIDTHFHLDFICKRLGWQPENFKEFLNHFGDEMPRSFVGCIAVFCKPDTWMIYGLEDRILVDSNIWTTFGVHPHFSDQFNAVVQRSLEELLNRKNVVALGEIGLDYSFKNGIDAVTQKEVFASQLRIAIRKKLPICLHIRDATGDAFEALDNEGFYGTDHPLHLHCYTQTWSECSQWLAKYPGLMVGLTPFICNTSWEKPIHEVVRQIPLDRVLLETDAPYFLPPKLKFAKDGAFQAGEDPPPSHPGHVIHTAAQVAAIKGIPIESVLYQTRINVSKMYGI